MIVIFFEGASQYIDGFLGVLEGVTTFMNGVFTGNWEKAWTGVKEIFGGKSPDDFDEETLTTINKFFENSLNVSETSRQLFILYNCSQS